MTSGLPEGVWHRRCANPGPMTLTGTNTYVVVPVGHSEGLCAAVIDPGPQDAEHCHAVVDRVVQMIEDRDLPRAVDVVMTHHHADHEGGVDDFVSALAERGVAAKLWGGDSGSRPPLELDEFTVIDTPGHTQDSISLLLDRDGRRLLFTGDTVLGGSSSFVAHPDGNLAAYFDSLDELLAMSDGGAELMPGHGELGGSAHEAISQYITHRRARLDEVRAVLADNPDADAADVAAVVYAGVPENLALAVQAIVAAQLDYLRQ